VGAILGVLAFDFFFTQPYLSFAIYSPSDIWSVVLMLAISAVVTAVASRSRSRASAARIAAERGAAVQGVAQRVMAAAPRSEVRQAAAEALAGIFRSPAVILVQEGGAMRLAGVAGGAAPGPVDEAAARSALADRRHVLGGAYPYDAARFDFWPVESRSGGRCAVGLDFSSLPGGRPAAPERFVDLIAACLAATLDRS